MSLPIFGTPISFNAKNFLSTKKSGPCMLKIMWKKVVYVSISIKEHNLHKEPHATKAFNN